jgi:uncharacterized membrane protein
MVNKRAGGWMVTIDGSGTLHERVCRLERLLAATIDQVERSPAEAEDRAERLESGLPVMPGAAASGGLVAGDRRTADAADRRFVENPPAAATVGTIAAWDTTALSDLVGGRVLAWIGGLAVVLAIVLFLALAVSHGWIDQQARVALAGLSSIALLAGGAWLHPHRGQTEAARTMVGAGTAGLFATLVVAAEVYHLVAPVLCLALALLVGAIATDLAIRWAGRAVASLGLGGALLAPVLVGAPSGIATLAMLGVASAYAMTVAVREDWQWLGLATVVATAPQWAGWAISSRPALLEAVVLVGFTVLGLAGGVGADLLRAKTRSAAPVDPAEAPGLATAPGAGSVSTSLVLLCLSACVSALVGYVGLSRSSGHTAAVLWLLVVAALHAGAGLAPSLARELSGRTRAVLVGIGLLFADVAFGLSAHGIVLTLGWAAVSVVFAWRVRRAAERVGPLEAGLGAHIALVLIRVVLVAPPGAGSLVALLSIATLAASSLVCAQLSSDRRPGAATALTVLGLASIAYLTATALSGAGLAAAWALEGLALIRLGVDGDDTAWFGGLAFVGLAAAQALIGEAPATGLVRGVGDLLPALIALAAIGGATFTAGRLHPPASPRRRGLLGASAVCTLYLASIAIVTAVEHNPAGATHAVLDLSVRQQAQVALSALWSLAGLGAVTLGLRRGLGAVRIGGLALLLVAVGKVFTYDLSALDSIYRVASILTLGLLLLAAALTYQRLRPPPPPDLRSLHPSQR